MKFKAKRSLTSDDLEQLASVFRKYPDIQAVYLFGSLATGKTHSESDIDLAIVPRSSTLRERKLDIITDIGGAGFDAVSLVFLDTKDLVLKYEAVRLNRVIYQTEDFDRGGTYSRILRAYWDFMPYFKVQREAFKRRILNDQA